VRKLLIVPCLLISFSGPALAASAQVAGIHAPASIALTDLNHDGIPDVVNSTASGLFVQLGIGDGRFKPPIKVLESNLSFESEFGFPSGRKIAFGDFNADSHPDIAFVSCTRGGCSLVVLLGNGDGTFQPQRAFDSSGALGGLAVGDFNGDGILDVALANYANGTVDLLLGNGDGTFQPPHPIARAGASSVAAADLSGSGRPDLVVADWDASTVQVLRNDGRGAFHPDPALATGPNPTHVTLADLRGNGRLDIVTLDANYAVSVLLGDLDGRFEPATTVYTAVLPATLQDLAVGDMEGNGVPALIVVGQAFADEAAAAVEILSGNGDGTFQEPVAIAAGATPSAVAVADVNRDALPDLIVADRRGAATVILNQSLLTARLPRALAPAAGNQAGSAQPRDNRLSPSRSPALPLTTTATPTVSVSILPANAVPWGKPLMLRITVSGAPSAITARSSAILFSIDNGPAATLPLALGSTTIPIPPLRVGAHALLVRHAAQASCTVLQAQPLTVTVTQATPTLTWANPVPIAYGAVLGATQFNATASVPGTFAYSPPAGTALSAGSQTLSVTFTPNDTTDYTTATATVLLTVNPATPAITWAAPASMAYGTALGATQLDASSPVAGTFAYTPASGTILSPGSHSIAFTFTPNDTLDYTTATATVTQLVGPNIETQPASLTVILGHNAAFSVTAAGAGPLHYQWQYWTGTAWAASTGGTGCTANSMVTAATTAAISGSQFRALVTDANGVSAASNTATLTVSPIITTQPASQAVPVGSTASFTVAVSGVPGISYQWQYQSGSTWVSIATGSGTNSATFTTQPTAVTDNYTYFRVVTTDGNGLTVTSSVAKLTVTPAIVTQPVSLTATDGSSVTFTVVAAGVPNLNYRWKYWTGTGWANYTTAIGYESPTMTIHTASIPLNGLMLEAVVIDGDGISVASDTVTLSVAPAITTQPTHQTEPVKWAATFSVVAVGVPTLTYQWNYLDSSNVWVPFTNCIVCNAATLVTNANKMADNGTQLQVVVTDGNGLTVTSKTVVLTVIL
jgi:hypothetical protein